MFLQPLKLKSSNLFLLNISYLVLKHLSLPWGRERLLKTTTTLVVGLHLHRLKVKPSKQLLVHLQNCTRFQNIIKCNLLYLNYIYTITVLLFQWTMKLKYDFCQVFTTMHAELTVNVQKPWVYTEKNLNLNPYVNLP